MKIEINLYYAYGNFMTSKLNTFLLNDLIHFHICYIVLIRYAFLQRDIAVFILTVGTVYQRVFFHRLLLCIRGKQEMIEHILASQDSGKTP